MDAQSGTTVEESAHLSGYGGHKRVKGRKRHLLVDTLGPPLSIWVTQTSKYDKVGARRVLAGVRPLVPRLAKIWANGGYTSRTLMHWYAQSGGWNLEIVERASKGSRLRSPSTALGSRTKLCVAGTQSSLTDRLRARRTDERDALRSGVHLPPLETAREENRMNDQTRSHD